MSCLWEHHKTVGMNSTHCWQELKGGIQREIASALSLSLCARACVRACVRPSLEVGTSGLLYQMRSVESCGRSGLHTWQFQVSCSVIFLGQL